MHEVGRRAALEGLAVAAAELSRRPGEWRYLGYLRLGELGADALRIAEDVQRLSDREPERPELLTVRLSGREYRDADLHEAIGQLGELAAVPSEKWLDEDHLAAVRVTARVIAFAAFRLRDRRLAHPRVLAWGAAAALLVFLVFVLPAWMRW